MQDTRKQAEDFVNQVFRHLPADLRRYREELEDNLRAALSAAFARMDLVTREEFDVQAALLRRTRALVEELEQRVAELERRIDAAEADKD